MNLHCGSAGQHHKAMLEVISGGNFWKDLSKWICTSHEEASGAEENDSATVRLEVLELLSGRVMETGKAMKSSVPAVVEGSLPTQLYCVRCN